MSDPPNSSSIQYPHDGFFKESMSLRQVYIPFLRTYLPLEMALSIDFDSIQPSKDHFVEEDLRPLYSDCLFHARLTGGTGGGDPDAEEIQIYVLVEHQSTVDPLIALRMWRYMHAAWRRYLNEHPKAKKVPLIVPLLLYHDKADYAACLDIRELINAPQHLVDLVWNEPIHLIDLHRIPDKQLREQTEISAILLAMKHIRDEVFPLDLLLEALAGVEDSERLILFLKMVVNYIFVTRRDLEADHIRKQVGKQLGSRAEEAVMTVAEKLRKEGKKEGREEGREEGRKEGRKEGKKEERIKIARILLQTGHSEDYLIQHLDVDPAELERIRSLSDKRTN
jgi:predicted transposase/invertase (TIGR01784 family)